MNQGENTSSAGKTIDRRSASGWASRFALLAAALVCSGWAADAAATCGDYIVYGLADGTHTDSPAAVTAAVWSVEGDGTAATVAASPTQPCDGPQCRSIPQDQGLPDSSMIESGPSLRVALVSEGMALDSDHCSQRGGGSVACAGRFIVVPAPDRPPGTASIQ